MCRGVDRHDRQAASCSFERGQFPAPATSGMDVGVKALVGTGKLVVRNTVALSCLEGPIEIDAVVSPPEVDEMPDGNAGRFVGVRVEIGLQLRPGLPRDERLLVTGGTCRGLVEDPGWQLEVMRDQVPTVGALAIGPVSQVRHRLDE